MEASSDSEQDFEAEQDKILLSELSRQQQHQREAATRKRRPAELLPVGLDSDQSSDADDDEDEDATAFGQYQDLLKRARLQRLRKEVAEDMGDGSGDGDSEEEDADADRQWATSRRYQYAAGDSDDDEGEGDDDGGDGDAGAAAASTARLMREERERLRRRMLGVGLPSDLPTVAAGATSASAQRASRPAPGETSAPALVRLASELPAYKPAPPGVPLERHLLAGPGPDTWPDMSRAYALKIRLESRLKPLAGRPEAELSDLQAAVKWHYILLCAYLRMRACGASLHRHPVRQLLQRAGEALRRLGCDDAEKTAASSAKKSKPRAKPTKVAPVPAAIAESPDTAAEAEDQEGKEAGNQHRPIYWEMQKNLPVQLHKRRRRDTKRRKPGDSNPRVKLRDKYRRALIKRRSQVPDVRPEVNRYSGEGSGIRAGLVKSRKFK